MGISGGMYGYGGVREVPSGGAELGQSLASLGQGLQRIIDPNYELQKQLKQSMALNPDLGQAIADRAYETGDPSFLDKMIGGKMANQIRQIQPSALSQMTVGIKHKLGPEGLKDPDKFHEMMMSIPPGMRSVLADHMHMPMYKGEQEEAAASKATSEATTAGNQATLSTANVGQQVPNVNAPVDLGAAYKSLKETGDFPSGVNPMDVINKPGGKELIDSARGIYEGNQRIKQQADALKARTGMAMDKQTETLRKNFYSENKGDLIGLSAFDNAIASAKQEQNPAAREQFLANFVQTMDQKAQFRQMMFDRLSKINESLAGRFANYFDKLDSGTLPPDQLDDAMNVMQAAHASHMKRWDEARNFRLRTHPELADWIPDSAHIMGNLSELGDAGVDPTTGTRADVEARVKARGGSSGGGATLGIGGPGGPNSQTPIKIWKDEDFADLKPKKP